ncbi:MAG: hypothetical protein WD404_06750 [Solirubrobacterales bacterium]
MKLGRLSDGGKVAVISAILLFVSMFFDWYGVESSDDSLRLFDVGRSAWEALDYIPIALLIGIVAALGNAALHVGNAVRGLAVVANGVVAVCGALSAVLILFRIIYPPSFGSMGTSFGVVTYEGTVKFPIFFALAAACGIAYGGYRAMREERDRQQGHQHSQGLPAQST